MIPGLASAILATSNGIVYAASANNVNPWVEMGSPAAGIRVSIFVAPGVVIGSTTPASPSMTLAFWDKSVVDLFVSGKIGAAGGVGGQGDRGRNNDNPSSSFVGGGGGGGAGSVPGAGGAAATEADPDDDSTDGAAGTATTGGAGGLSDYGAAIPNSITFTPGSQVNRLAKNPAILIWPASGHTITVNIWNNGSIFAGGDGGIGGYQDAGLPGGAHDGANGEDLPNYVDYAPGVGVVDHPVIWKRTGQVSLTLNAGATHPSIKGRIVTSSSLP